jgi:cell division protein FtsN
MGSDEIGSSAETPNEQSDLKRKLAWRMGFAGLMIAVLLGTLAFFDRMSSSEEPDSASARSAQPALESKKDVTQPVKVAELPLEVSKDVKVAAEPEESTAPLDKSSPLAEPVTRPQILAQPATPRVNADSGVKPLTKSTVKPEPRPEAKSGHRVPPRNEAGSEPQSEVRSPPQSPPSGRPMVVPSVPSTPLAPPNAVPKPPQSLPVQAASAPPPANTEDYLAVARPQPAPLRLFSGYALQAGIFSDLRRAEELHAKLTLNGIPSTFEARVNVGPFKRREEAIAAREKMKALGIDSVLLLPKGVKR